MLHNQSLQFLACEQVLKNLVRANNDEQTLLLNRLRFLYQIPSYRDVIKQAAFSMIDQLGMLYCDISGLSLPHALITMKPYHKEKLLYWAVRQRRPREEIEYISVDLHLDRLPIAFRAVNNLSSRPAELMCFLQRSGIDINEITRGAPPIVVAVKSGNPDAVRAMLLCGANPHFKFETGMGLVSFAKNVIEDKDARKEIMGLLQHAIIGVNRIRRITI